MKWSLSILILLLGLAVASPASAEYLPTKAQVDVAISLIPRLGQPVGNNLGVQVHRHRKGTAMFWISSGGEYFWGLEEREVILEGETLVTRWEFYANHATMGRYIFAQDHAVTAIHHPEPMEVTSPEVISKSELAWMVLTSTNL